MAPPPGVHELGPEEVTLAVRTTRVGAASKAGHDLLLHVTSWSAKLAIDEDVARSSLELTADGSSLRVQEGTGGAFALGDEEIASIQQSIDDDVLKGSEIAFRSTGAEAAGDGGIHFDGALTILGETRPVGFDLEIGDDGTVHGAVTVTQSEWGMKQFTILFGALKVADDVEVSADGHL